MSILIKREMPKGCWACPFAVGKHYECLFTKKSYNWGLTTRPSDCPLISVPAPHGRLIDADAFEDAFNMELLPILINKYGEEEALKGLHFSFRDCICNIQAQKTVIEAEGSKE